jgi:hypothetical protein
MARLGNWLTMSVAKLPAPSSEACAAMVRN